MRQSTIFIMLPGGLAIVTLLVFLLLTTFPRSAIANDETVDGPKNEPIEDPIPLCHRVGFQTTLFDISRYSGIYTVDFIFFSAEIGAFYEWEANPNFALGSEFNYSRPLIADTSDKEFEADVFRLGARLRVMIPLVEKKVKLFLLIHGGLAIMHQSHRKTFVGGYVFGEVGVTWWIKPNWSVSVGLDTGIDTSGKDMSGISPGEYFMQHLVRLPIEVIYRF